MAKRLTREEGESLSHPVPACPTHFCSPQKTLTYNLIRAGRFDAGNFAKASPFVFDSAYVLCLFGRKYEEGRLTNPLAERGVVECGKRAEG